MMEYILATEGEELDEVYKFRYSIYVEEMARKQEYVDHCNKIIKDPLDNFAHNIVALKDKKICGVIRVNYYRDGDLSYYPDLYQMMRIPNSSKDNSSITTRLMIHSDYRKKHPLAVNLCLEAYKLGLSDNIKHNFMDCNTHLVSYFKSLGFREYMQTVKHKEYGEVHPMWLDMHDEQHLTKLNSPFKKTLIESLSFLESCDAAEPNAHETF